MLVSYSYDTDAPWREYEEIDECGGDNLVTILKHAGC